MSAIPKFILAPLGADHLDVQSPNRTTVFSWGMKDPSNFLLKVKPEVIVELELSGGVKTRQ